MLVCGHLLADQGATVTADDQADKSKLARALNRRKRTGRDNASMAAADIIISCGSPRAAARGSQSPEALRRAYPNAVIVHVSPYGLDGPRADQAASDLTLFAASGIARMLIGQVDDLEAEPPQRPVGNQAGFIGGIAAACAAVNALAGGQPAFVDVSQYEALATLAIPELTRAANGAPIKPRKRVSDGNGATVCVLPCSDGYVAISPREAHQWRSWLNVLGNPEWAENPKFRTKSDRVAHWDELHALMSDWSRQRTRDTIAATAQEAHVPSFPLRRLAEHFDSEQLRSRGFFEHGWLGDRPAKLPRTPFQVRVNGATGRLARSAENSEPLPLAGVRVLDFSWVIAGPTTTRYLAALGAEVIKVEAPGRGDPGRGSELHSVLGQAKQAIVLDLKNPHGLKIAKDLAATSDLVIENFATGVMERFGLGPDELLARYPALSYVSASGMGRTGPQAKAVAYGTLLQCYGGFAELNGVPGKPPRVGMAWLDPMCALLLAFIAGAAVHYRRRRGLGVRVDFSMVEAMLWTLTEPLLAVQEGEPIAAIGNRSGKFTPHDIYRAQGEDAWIAIAVETAEQWRALCQIVPGLADKSGWPVADRLAHRDAIDARLRDWCTGRSPGELEALLAGASVPAAKIASADDLARCPQLASRKFWDELSTGIAPGLPWRVDFGRALGIAPRVGEHTELVLRNTLGLDQQAVQSLREQGAFGPGEVPQSSPAAATGSSASPDMLNPSKPSAST